MSLVGFLISFVLLLVLMTWYQFALDWSILFLPAFLILAVVVSIGPILRLAALNVQDRDFCYVVPFLVQFGLFISPVGFGSSIIPDKWRIIYSLNPMVGVVDAFRWSVFCGQT